MKVLVTGGTGFLGTRLVQKLLQRGDKITVICRTPESELEGKVSFVLGDIRNKNVIRKAFDGVEIVYHLAICLDESNPEMYDTNVSGTKNVAELCKEFKVKQLIYMSSSGVLGETKEPSREDFPYRPKTRYEKSKMESEKLIIASGVPYTIIRTTIILGPNIIWTQIFGAARKGYPLLGSGKNKFHLVYINDVVSILDHVKGNAKSLNQTFHIASPDVPTYKEVYQMICDELRIPMTTKHIPLFFAYLMSSLHSLSCKIKRTKPKLTLMRSSIDRLVRNRVLSIEKAKRVLGFEPKYTTKQAINETVKYLQIARLGYSDLDLAKLSAHKK
jgi:nucleoside-diphosphate-sugar epimerase